MLATAHSAPQYDLQGLIKAIAEASAEDSLNPNMLALAQWELLAPYLQPCVLAPSQVLFIDSAALVQAARQRGVRVHPLSPLFNPRGPAAASRRPAGLVMGYALLDREAIEDGVRSLAQALPEVRRLIQRSP